MKETLNDGSEESVGSVRGNMGKDAMEILQTRLMDGIRSVLDSDNFKNWLNTRDKLFYNRYSFNNAMLIWSQKPDATYVMGQIAWKDFGREVEQGRSGAKIFIPQMATERYKGRLFQIIKSALNTRLTQNPSATEASYRLGSSDIEFTMNRANGLIGLKIGGREKRIFGSEAEVKLFIDRNIIGKVPTRFIVGEVFDVKDVTIPQYLWLRFGFTNAEIAKDVYGNPTKSSKGETKIINTPERQARFQKELDTSIAAQDPAKMSRLFEALCSVCNKKSFPVFESDKADDKLLNDGAKGYCSHRITDSDDLPNGRIVIDKDLDVTEKCAVLLHEMGHADMHGNLFALAQKMGEDKVSRSMLELQAEAVSYATASAFGIETDTSSFAYLTVYSNGFELQDFQKSLEVIYKETQSLTKDIKKELDIRGLNLDLTEKPRDMLNDVTKSKSAVGKGTGRTRAEWASEILAEKQKARSVKPKEKTQKSKKHGER